MYLFIYYEYTEPFCSINEKVVICSIGIRLNYRDKKEYIN